MQDGGGSGPVGPGGSNRNIAKQHDTKVEGGLEGDESRKQRAEARRREEGVQAGEGEGAREGRAERGPGRGAGPRARRQLHLVVGTLRRPRRVGDGACLGNGPG